MSRSSLLHKTQHNKKGEKKKKSHAGLKRSGLPILVVRLSCKKLGQLSGSPMVVLFERIKKCRFASMEWSHVAFGSSKTLLKEKQHRLEELCSLNNFEFLDEIKEVNEIGRAHV